MCVVNKANFEPQPEPWWVVVLWQPSSSREYELSQSLTFSFNLRPGFALTWFSSAVKKQVSITKAKQNSEYARWTVSLPSDACTE